MNITITIMQWHMNTTIIGPIPTQRTGVKDAKMQVDDAVSLLKKMSDVYEKGAKAVVTTPYINNNPFDIAWLVKFAESPPCMFNVQRIGKLPTIYSLLGAYR